MATARRGRGGGWAIVALATLLVAFAGCTERGDAFSIQVANRTQQPAEIRLAIGVDSFLHPGETYGERFNRTFSVQPGTEANAVETRLRTGSYSAVASSGPIRNESTFQLKEINRDEIRSIEVVLEDGGIALRVHGTKWAITPTSMPTASPS